MHRLLTLLFIGLLSACGSGSSNEGPRPEPAPDVRVLDEHACFEGTWLAVSRNIKIGDEEYPVATDRVFIVVSDQTNVSTSDELSNGQTSYSGSGLRTWYTKNNFTEDIHAGAWLATFNSDTPEAKGSLAIQDACRHVYAGEVIDTNLPQCRSSQLFNRNTELTLNCSGDVGILTMENARTSINFQRVSENEDIIAFTRDDEDGGVDLDTPAPIPVDILDDDELEDVIRENYGDDDTTDEEIADILEEILDEPGEDDDSSPQNDTNPLSPELDPNDIDTDGDGIPDYLDAFPFNANESLDTDGDGVGNNQDTDDDNDTEPDTTDAFPLDPTEQKDTDNDGHGNNSDVDDDNDGTQDSEDVFPLDQSEDTDTDGDGIGNNADPDDDNDSVNDPMDMLPLDPDEWMDTDGDGVGNNRDVDDDGDLVLDDEDAFPVDGTEWIDSDGDGVGNNADMDDDNDGLSDIQEAIIGTNTLNADTDNDTVIDGEDAFPLDSTEHSDSDGDGVGDNADAFPFDASESMDSDGDGVGDNADAFPFDASESKDSDGDGVGDNADAFPFDASESKDSDGDGVGDNADAFPFDASESMDSDGDGVGDNADAFPFDPTRSEPDPEPEDPSIATQDWQSFYTGQDWYLTDFDLPEGATRGDYVTEDGEILFDIRWTRRTRNHLADHFGYDREEMTHEFANMLCPPMIEVGKASVYGVGDSENMIAELDSDLYHCNINGDEPANVRIRSFIPTKVGYAYKATAQYRMRDYNMPNNAYRHFVMRFGKTAEHYEPVFGDWGNAEIEITARHKFTKLVLRDNGLPDSYGILVDNIEIEEIGKVPHYDACANLFSENSKGFRKCIAGEIDSNQSCTVDTLQVGKIKNPDVPDDRAIPDNVFTLEDAMNGNINFMSLGLRGRIRIRCEIDGYAATYPIYNQRLSFREISWGNATPDSYPEQARVKAKLTHCVNDDLNGVHHLGLVSTNETFSYEFTENDEGVSYEGCRLKHLIIKDKTPKTSPSTDGFDINSLNIQPADQPIDDWDENIPEVL